LAPFNVTVPNPDSAGSGKVPTSPVIVVGPVFVMPVPPSTAKLSAVPRPTGAAAKVDAGNRSSATPVTTASEAMRGTFRRDLLVAPTAGASVGSDGMASSSSEVGEDRVEHRRPGHRARYR
jgi:hypothetical protein